MALTYVRHIMKGSQAHLGRVGGRTPEAQVKVWIAGHAVSLVGRWIRGG